MSQLPVPQLISQAFFAEVPAYQVAMRAVSVPVSTPTRVVLANPRRFLVQIVVNSSTTIQIALTSQVSATFGLVYGGGSSPAWLWYQVGSMTCGEFWAFSASGIATLTVLEGTLTV